MPAALLVAVAGQAQVFIVGALLGVDQAGVFRATQAFTQPIVLSITALVGLLTPSLSHEFARGDIRAFRTKATLATVGFTGMALVFALALLLFHVPLERLVYGGKFASYAYLIPLWGVTGIIPALYSGIMASLQAARRPSALLIAAIIWMPMSIGLGVEFTLRWNLKGSVLSVLAGYMIFWLVYCVLYWHWISGLDSMAERHG
jgi:O-antigen/teichoic acid export membrane protein